MKFLEKVLNIYHGAHCQKLYMMKVHTDPENYIEFFLNIVGSKMPVSYFFNEFPPAVS